MEAQQGPGSGLGSGPGLDACSRFYTGQIAQVRSPARERIHRKIRRTSIDMMGGRYLFDGLLSVEYRPGGFARN